MGSGGLNSDDHDRKSGLNSIILSQLEPNCEYLPKRWLRDARTPLPFRARKAPVSIGYSLCSGQPWA